MYIYIYIYIFFLFFLLNNYSMKVKGGWSRDPSHLYSLLEEHAFYFYHMWYYHNTFWSYYDESLTLIFFFFFFGESTLILIIKLCTFIQILTKNRVLYHCLVLKNNNNENIMALLNFICLYSTGNYWNFLRQQ